jgi:hypothetical protein
MVSDRPYTVNFVAPEGQGTMETGWYAQELHTWVEVYYPQKGAWAAYDPFLNFGFVDQRHVKSGIALDTDIVGKTTGGSGNLLEVFSLNNGVSVQSTMNLGLSQVTDSGSYSFRRLLEAPGGTDVYVLGRDMVNAPTVTPAATPTPTVTPVPCATPTSTPMPVPNATVSPTPKPLANATVTPLPSPTAAATHPDMDVAGAGVVQNIRLSQETGTDQAKPSGTTPGFELITALAGLLIITLYRYGRA